MALLIPSPEVSSLAFEITRPRRTRIGNVKSRVCSKLQNLDKDDLKFNNNGEDNLMWLYGQVKLQIETTSPPSRNSSEEDKKKKKKQDYYVNTGYAIRTLREEYPQLFHTELTFDIYRDDIVFKDPVNTFAGIENYKSIFWALRFHGRIFFTALWVDIVSVWQPVDNMIVVRWTVHGIPRVPWESRSRFDGTSEYKLDKDGKIYEHRVHNIAMNGPQKFQILAVDQLIQSIGGSSTPKPTFFEFSSSSMPSVAALLKLQVLKQYFASGSEAES